MKLKAEIIRLKTELEDRELVVVQLKDEVAGLQKAVVRAYEKGFVEGETKQAILELQGRDRFIENLKQEMAEKNNAV